MVLPIYKTRILNVRLVEICGARRLNCTVYGKTALGFTINALQMEWPPDKLYRVTVADCASRPTHRPRSNSLNITKAL